MATHPNVVENETDLADITRRVQVAAVVGMKGENQPSVPAFEIPNALKRRGIRVIPVNPTITTALGQPSLPDLSALTERPDMVLVFRRSDVIGEVADDVLRLPADRRPSVVWLQSGIRNDQAATRLAEAGIRVVQDRCLSVYASRYRR
jgi:predicted CoA-binding protein